MALTGWNQTQVRSITIPATDVAQGQTNISIPLYINSTSGDTDYDNTDVFAKLVPTDVDDDFTGTNGDPANRSFWDMYEGTFLEIQSNKLMWDNGGVTAGSAVRSRYKLSGNFVIQVDIDLGTYPGGSLWGAFLAMAPVDLAGADWGYITLSNFGGGLGYRGSTKVSGSSQASTSSTSDTTAILQIERSGTTVTTKYWNGSSFTTVHTRTGFTSSDVYVLLRGYSDAGSLIFNFDDFEVVSGTVVWENTPKRMALEVGSSGVETYIENVFWDATNEEALINAKLPSLSATVDNVFNFYYDQDQSDNTTYVGDIGSTPGQTVYDSVVKFFANMSQDPSGTAPQILESTSIGADGTSNGTMTSGDLVDLVSGKGLDLDGTDDYINFGYNSAHDITDVLTLEAIIKPSTLLDSGLTNPVGIISRRYDPTDAEDTYSLTINTAGKLQLSSGTTGSIQSTTASWTSGNEYYVGATFNSTGLVGNLFVYDITGGGTGGKETLTVDALSSMTGSVNNLVVGKEQDTSEFFPGVIGATRVINQVKNDDYFELIGNSFADNLVTWSLRSGLIVTFLEQDYDITSRMYQFLSQPYEMTDVIITHLEQVYGMSLGAFLVQPYDDAANLIAKIDQYYKDAPYLTQFVEQLYENSQVLIQQLIQRYGINRNRQNFIEQVYNMLGVENKAFTNQLYDLKTGEELKRILNQIYQIASDGNYLQQTNTLTIDGTEVGFISASLEFGQEEYVGVLECELLRQEDWDTTDYLQEVVFTVGTDVYNFVIFGKNKSQNVTNTQWFIEARSKGYLLDFPYAEPVASGFALGMASDIVNRLAALEGQTVTWNMPVDWFLTSEDVQFDEDSPIEGIRKIVGAVGGVVQSNPDGTLYAAPRYEVDSDKYNEATPETYLTTGENFETLESTTDKRSGFNIYFVTNVPSASGNYRMETEKVSSSEYLVKVYQDPWDETQLVLETSEQDSVIIGQLAGIATEEHCELIELVEGEGQTDFPIYEQTSFDYLENENLGLITFTESGNINSFIQGESLVQYTYRSRYRRWRVSNVDTENVQLILSSVD